MAGFPVLYTIAALLIAVRPCYFFQSHNRIVNCYEEVCHKHSGHCSQLKRICNNCEDNTHGSHCELCLDGFYGNATIDKYGCKRCPCPLTHSNGLCKNDNKTNSIECLKCKQGYHGKLCTDCDKGYYKSESDGLCQPCFCNGYGNESIVQKCHPIGGRCFFCSNKRAGKHCESCIDGYYLKVINRTEQCVACNCSGNSSPGTWPMCDLRHGICLQCPFNTTGRNCENCAKGYEGDALKAKNCTKIQHPDFGSRPSTSRYIIVALVTVLSIIIVVFVAVTLVVWFRRKRSRDPLGFVTINMSHTDEEDYNIAWIDPVTGDPIRHNAVDIQMPLANGNMELHGPSDDYDDDDDLGDIHEPESRDTDRML
ncbi:laminin subunit gamma-1-like [Rhopilema esculentum]|uniref:laminin subunit gamma-1-like n=1 Tax=Rhopilema esculentum TaxID=499914 RepID=UPI0031D6019D